MSARVEELYAVLVDQGDGELFVLARRWKDSAEREAMPKDRVVRFIRAEGDAQPAAPPTPPNRQGPPR